MPAENLPDGFTASYHDIDKRPGAVRWTLYTPDDLSIATSEEDDITAAKAATRAAVRGFHAGLIYNDQKLPTTPGANVGANVHYVAHGTPVRKDGTQAYPSVCRAATITTTPTPSGHASLFVMNPTGAFFNASVPKHTGEPQGGDVQPGAAYCPHTGRVHPGGSWHLISP